MHLKSRLEKLENADGNSRKIVTLIGDDLTLWEPLKAEYFSQHGGSSDDDIIFLQIVDNFGARPDDGMDHSGRIGDIY